MDILNSMLQMAVLSAYNREGIEEAFKVLKDEADARKDNKKRKAKNFDEMEFKCSYAGTTLMVIECLLSMKPVSKNKDDLNFIANKLIEVANELREL